MLGYKLGCLKGIINFMNHYKGIRIFALNPCFFFYCFCELEENLAKIKRSLYTIVMDKENSSLK